MVITSKGTFVYGRFVHEGPDLWVPPVPSLRPEIAIEIVREFSATEFIGKIYVRTGDSNWGQLTDAGARNYDWYKGVLQGKKGTKWFWEMRGGDRWEVLHFKTEVDESGPYVAVALKHHPGKKS